MTTAQGISVGQYDATTGATVNASLVKGSTYDYWYGIAVVPEPSSLVLAGIGLLSLLTYLRQRRRRLPHYLNRPKWSVI